MEYDQDRLEKLTSLSINITLGALSPFTFIFIFWTDTTGIYRERWQILLLLLATVIAINTFIAIGLKFSQVSSRAFKYLATLVWSTLLILCIFPFAAIIIESWN